MKQFMCDNFLLESKTAERLYHDYAKVMPIYDFHCHLSPQEIWENKTYKNITELWLYGDHYKWRAMRSNGVEEALITGDASDYDKFRAWAATLSYAIGNPLYHWTHLELRRYFGINEVLSEETADAVWQKANALIRDGGFGARDLIEKSNVALICTTDDPVDSLEYHRKIRESGQMKTLVLPTFRPDKGLNIAAGGFADWVGLLSKASGITIGSYADFLVALRQRFDFFVSQGCRISDHALDYVPYAEATVDEAATIFQKAMDGKSISRAEEEQYKTYTLRFLTKLYAQSGCVLQIHIGAMRNNNTAMFKSIGADTGFDSIGDPGIARSLSRFMDSMASEGLLPKTILYAANPKDNYPLGTMLGNFQAGGIPGKIQLGSAWWFNDQKEGMLAQMNALASLGLLNRFVGMLTDSRSFLSYTRHEYFRRILCNLIGGWVENGEYPKDMKMLSKIVQGICANNIREYLGLDV